MIPITKPFLPPIEQYEAYINKIWERNWLTNDGPLVNELEEKLKDRFGIAHVLYVNSGTMALQFAIKALGLEGEIITTPFSYVATTNSIVWEKCNPVFVDIDSETLNVDPSKIEEAITDSTSAILATHVFGVPCEVEKISNIAREYNLKVIYDAAHCFDTCYNKESIFKWGDISITSFHATKLFQTIEGGGLFTGSEKLAQKIDYMRNFGHDGFGKFNGVGINGKNSEFHAAMGLCNLNYIDSIISKRKEQCNLYDELLKELNIKSPNSHSNFALAYYPVLFANEAQLLKIKEVLANNNIETRRYFYPSLNTLSHVSYNPTPISEKISTTILCLPLYHKLKTRDQERIASIIRKSLDD